MFKDTGIFLDFPRTDPALQIREGRYGRKKEGGCAKKPDRKRAIAGARKGGRLLHLPTALKNVTSLANKRAAETAKGWPRERGREGGM